MGMKKRETAVAPAAEQDEFADWSIKDLKRALKSAQSDVRNAMERVEFLRNERSDLQTKLWNTENETRAKISTLERELAQEKAGHVAVKRRFVEFAASVKDGPSTPSVEDIDVLVRVVTGSAHAQPELIAMSHWGPFRIMTTERRGENDPRAMADFFKRCQIALDSYLIRRGVVPAIVPDPAAEPPQLPAAPEPDVPEPDDDPYEGSWREAADNEGARIAAEAGADAGGDNGTA